MCAPSQYTHPLLFSLIYKLVNFTGFQERSPSNLRDYYRLQFMAFFMAGFERHICAARHRTPAGPVAYLDGS